MSFVNVSNHSNHPYKFSHIFSRTNAYKFSFFPLVIPFWNDLPNSAANAESYCLPSECFANHKTTLLCNVNIRYSFILLIFLCPLFCFIADCLSILYSHTTSRINTIKYVFANDTPRLQTV